MTDNTAHIEEAIAALPPAAQQVMARAVLGGVRFTRSDHGWRATNQHGYAIMSRTLLTMLDKIENVSISDLGENKYDWGNND